jgi:outer membrane protein TolC
MSRRLLLRVPIFLFLASSLFPRLSALAQERPISLDEAVRYAIEGNLDLRAESYNPALSETDIRRARAIYDPKFSALFDHRGEDAPVDAGGVLYDRMRFFDANLSTSFLLSSGATATAAFTNLWNRSNLVLGSGQDTATTSFVEPKLSLSLAQPLLQGFGREITEQGITVAKYGKEGSLLRWRNAANTTVAGVRDQYFSLLKARENLSTRRAAVAVLKEVHAANQARVKAGVLAAVELLDSEFGVAQAEVELLTAEKNVRDAVDRLRTIIQFPPGTELIPIDAAPPPLEAQPEDRVIVTALRDRPDLRAARVNLATQEFNARIAGDALRPSVSLTGSAGLEALKSGYSDAVSDLASAKFPFWSVGISFAYPLGNNAAESAFAASRLRARQSDAQLRSLEESIRLDVRIALRALETSSRQIAAARKGVDFGEARLASFVKRQKVGLAVTKDVLQAESDLTASREALASARADYQGAITLLWKSTGELLERHGILIDDKAIDTIGWKDIR